MNLQPLNPPKQKTDARYGRIWRIVDGAVADAFRRHPNYLTAAGDRAARLSIVKRVTGAVFGMTRRP